MIFDNLFRASAVTPFNVSALDEHVVAGPVVYESG